MVRYKINTWGFDIYDSKPCKYDILYLKVIK